MRPPRRRAQHRRAGVTDSIPDLLDGWEAEFAVLQEIVAFLDKEG